MPDASRVAPARLTIVDAARGMAIIQMVVYHFIYDLGHFGWIHVAMTRDAGWIAWRSAIVSQFLFLVGLSLVLRDTGRAPPGTATASLARRLFTPRWWHIAGCAALVSAGSALVFGPRWIWFGVLHFVVVAQLLMGLLMPALRRLGTANVLVGLALLAIGLSVNVPVFAPDGLSWIGFSPVKPRTEDFVPLMPWLGVVVLGMGAGFAWQAANGAWARRLRSVSGRAWRVPAAIGRWPLTVYMVHQPLLFGALTLLQWMLSRPG